MVKETKFDHQIVRIVKGLALGTEQEFGGIIMLDFQTANIATVVSSDSTVWTLLDLGAYAPAAARAAILDVAARDAAGAAGDYYFSVGNPCAAGAPITAAKTSIVYCGDVNDRWNSRIIVAVMNDDFKVPIRVAASGAVFDYTIKLLGWIMDPYTARITPPSEDLSCTLYVQQ